MLEYVYDTVISIIDSFKNIYPFELGDGLNGMFVGSLFYLILGYTIIELVLDYFNGDTSDSDSNSNSNSDKK